MRMRMRMTTTIWGTTHTYNAICTCMARCVAPRTIQHDKQCGTMHWTPLAPPATVSLSFTVSSVFLFRRAFVALAAVPFGNHFGGTFASPSDSGAHWATHATNVLAQHYYYRYLCCPYT